MLRYKFMVKKQKETKLILYCKCMPTHFKLISILYILHLGIDMEATWGETLK